MNLIPRMRDLMMRASSSYTSGSLNNASDEIKQALADLDERIEATMSRIHDPRRRESIMDLHRRVQAAREAMKTDWERPL